MLNWSKAARRSHGKGTNSVDRLRSGKSSTPEEFGQFVETELGKWQKIVKETGAKPE